MNNNQQELGGAQALLLLGSKNKDQDKDKEKESKQKDGDISKSSSSASSFNQFDQASRSQEDQADADEENEREAVAAAAVAAAVSEGEDEDVDSKATNQQINDAVEAAVMRYVGGNLDHDDKKSRKRLNPDEIISSIGDFQNWSGFLEEGINDPSNVDFAHHHHHQAQNQGQAINANSHAATPKRKRRRTLSLSQDIDPELTDLDTNSEHDQLVKAAILETRELAKQLGSAYNSLSHLPPHQAQQVLAAMQNSTGINNNHKPKASRADKNDDHHNNNESVSNINHLLQLAKDNNKSGSSFKSVDLQGGQHQVPGIDPHTNQTDLSHSQADTRNFSHITSIESLSEEASKIAINWFKKQPESKGPRSFSEEERCAVEYFIDGYCYLFKVNRKQVCERIWTTERKNDNFWECLTKVLPYRSRASVYKHVRRGYHVFDVRGKWNSEDDGLLTRLANTKQGNWKEIGAIMGRMPEDCRDRWRNYIKCGQNRLMSRWAPEEEEKLKQIVSDMLTKLDLNTINWTVVSEAMNGTRSRIQCRYKWNKLVKRESIVRASLMDIETKLWFFQKLKKLAFNKISDIDWQLIAKLYNEEHPNAVSNWLPSDFEHGFDKMKATIKGYRKLPFEKLIEKLVDGCLRNESKDDSLKHQNLTIQDSNHDLENDYMWR